MDLARVQLNTDNSSILHFRTKCFNLEEKCRMKAGAFKKGRGAQINPPNPYENQIRDRTPDPEAKTGTNYQAVSPKTLLNKVDSPDIGMSWSMNPYQGCEHGCVYCYARNTHPFWGYSAGLEFENNILVKTDAHKVLEKQIRKKSWAGEPIMLSGNTDCYQPAEQEYRLTRKILEVLWRYRHPVGIITKSSLILRDLDLLQPMAEKNLVKVSISLTTLHEDLRQLLEPRTATVLKRLRTIQELSDNGIPVNVMLAPIIPGRTDHEIMPMAEAVARRGARSIHHTVVRLNGDVAEIFGDWLEKTMPDRAERILNRIKDCHAGNLNDSQFGRRIKGEGRIAEMIDQQMILARRKFFEGREMPAYNRELFLQLKDPQLKIFE
jgi:DNA repair photolyase